MQQYVTEGSITKLGMGYYLEFFLARTDAVTNHKSRKITYQKASPSMCH